MVIGAGGVGQRSAAATYVAGVWQNKSRKREQREYGWVCWNQRSNSCESITQRIFFIVPENLEASRGSIGNVDLFSRESETLDQALALLFR